MAVGKVGEGNYLVVVGSDYEVSWLMDSRRRRQEPTLGRGE